jgi:hypothetical protein
MDRSTETARKADHLASFLQTMSKLRPAWFRRIRVSRLPSIHCSMGRIQLSRKTVWGHAYPHQSRPHSDVTKKSVNARKSIRRRRKIVSEAVRICPVT